MEIAGNNNGFHLVLWHLGHTHLQFACMHTHTHTDNKARTAYCSAQEEDLFQVAEKKQIHS